MAPLVLTSFLFFVSISVRVAVVVGILPPLPHCDQSYDNHVIDWISQNSGDSDVRYLGLAQSTADCKEKCQNINYVCGASHTNPDNYVYKDATSSTFAFDNDACDLEIFEGSWKLGSFILLTPNFTASEYVIELSCTLLNRGGSDNFFGLTFSASWSDRPYLFAAEHKNAPSRLFTGHCDSNTATGGADIDEDTDLVGTSVAMNEPQTISVHRQSDGYWSVSVNGVHQRTSSEAVPLAFPDNYVGVLARFSTVRAHSLRVTFPNSVDEMLCAAYMYDPSNTRCFGYYGDDYASMYDTLTTDASFDAGIIEYNACAPSGESSTTSTIAPASTTQYHECTGTDTNCHTINGYFTCDSGFISACSLPLTSNCDQPCLSTDQQPETTNAATSVPPTTKNPTSPPDAESLTTNEPTTSGPGTTEQTATTTNEVSSATTRNTVIIDVDSSMMITTFSPPSQATPAPDTTEPKQSTTTIETRGTELAANANNTLQSETTMLLSIGIPSFVVVAVVIVAMAIIRKKRKMLKNDVQLKEAEEEEEADHPEEPPQIVTLGALPAAHIVVDHDDEKKNDVNDDGNGPQSLQVEGGGEVFIYDPDMNYRVEGLRASIATQTHPTNDDDEDDDDEEDAIQHHVVATPLETRQPQPARNIVNADNGNQQARLQEDNTVTLYMM